MLGAGSLGSVVGGCLAGAGHDVVLVTRNSAHVAAVRGHGLRLDDGSRRHTIDVVAVTECDDLDPFDLVVVLVKSFDTHGAIVGAQRVIGRGTTVLTLQNGVGCEEVISDVIGPDRVIAGRTYVGGRIIEPGVVEYGVAGRRTTIGELDGRRTERIELIAATFRAAGLRTDVSGDIVSIMWEKLMVNVATGALSALTGLPYGELSVHPDVERCAIAAISEAIAVAEALGVGVVATDPDVLWRRAWEGLPYGFKASMLQSVEKGSRTEVDVMHGAVCRAGREVGVATPVNDTLLAAVHGLEHRLTL